MTPEQKAKAEAIIASQLAMNPATLAALGKAGLTPEHEAEIEFSFDAPSEAAAEALARHLRANDCPMASVTRVGSLFRRRYIVQGKSYPTPLSEEILAQWVPWMVVQGVLHDCTFDGWGVQA